MDSRNTCRYPLSSWRMSVPSPHQSLTKVTHIAESVSSAPRALLCSCCPVSLLRSTELMDMWILNKNESLGLRGSCLPQFWEVHWRSRIRGKKLSSFLSALFPISVAAVLRSWGPWQLLQLSWVRVVLLCLGSDQSLIWDPEQGPWAGGAHKQFAVSFCSVCPSWSLSS